MICIPRWQKSRSWEWQLKVDLMELAALYPEFGNVEELFI